MSDSPLIAALLQLQQVFRQEVARAVHQALAEHQPAPASAPPAPVLLNVREAAAFLQVSVATVHAWKRKGLIEYRKVGNRTLFEQAALLAAAQPQPTAFDGRRLSPRRKG
jgi:excisionase family DNA binding protein